MGSKQAPSSPAADNPMVAELRTKKKPLTVQQLADIIPFSIFTIYDWAKARKIPHMRIGSKILFDPQETAEWLKERCS